MAMPDLADLEIWVQSLAEKISRARRAEAKLSSRASTHNTYNAAIAPGANSRPDSEPDLNLEELRSVIENIVEEAKALASKLDDVEPRDSATEEQPLQAAPNAPNAPNAHHEDSSATEEQPQPAADTHDAQHTLLSANNPDAHKDGHANERQPPPENHATSLRRSQRTHTDAASKATGTLVENQGTPGNTRRRPRNVNVGQKHGNSPKSLPVLSQLQTPPKTIQLMQEQMQENLVRTLETNQHQERQPYAKYDIVDLKAINLAQSLINEHLLQYDYRRTSDRPYISHKRREQILLDPSDFKWSGPIPTQEDMRELFNDLCQHPPKTQQRPYYIGPVKPVEEVLGLGFEPLVHAGHRLCRRNNGNLPGINTVYMYISLGKDTPAPLHIEDAHLGSVNLVHVGAPKIWLIVDEEWADDLEERLLELYGVEKRCSQAIRHLNTMVCPDQLDEWGIPYYLDCCEAHQMIETKRRSYHQALNLGHNVAESVNIEYSNTPDLPSDTEYQWCQDTCGISDFLSKATFELSDCSNVQHVCLGQALHRGILEDTLTSSTLQANQVDVLRQALHSDELSLALCEKARVVQMIAHCYEPTAIPTECPLEADKEMFQIVKYFTTSKESVQFVGRIYLTKLASKCEEEEKRLRTENRMHAEKDYTTLALKNLTQGLKLSRREFDNLKTSRKYGATLREMCDALSRVVLTALPSQVIPANELYLPFSTKLQRKLEPSDYHKLCGTQLEFFLKWLPKMFPDKLKEKVDTIKPTLKEGWEDFTQEWFDQLSRGPKRQKRS